VSVRASVNCYHIHSGFFFVTHLHTHTYRRWYHV